MVSVSIIGAGPAGSAAAISARRAGFEVQLFEKSVFPRHKVCGEFLSPELAELLADLGVWRACERIEPARLRRIRLCLGAREKSWLLQEPAYGLSRFAMDRLLVESAQEAGALLKRENRQTAESPLIIAHGRRCRAPAGERLFGFKAHFSGPVDDSMSLFFFDGCYIGVNSVEQGKTNVCGLAPETKLRAMDFQIDDLLAGSAALRQRLSGLARSMNWLTTGPLVFGEAWKGLNGGAAYPAGDALSFVEPFTGSGMLAAVSTGILAGQAAGNGTPVIRYVETCRALFRSQYRVAALFRAAIDSGLAECLIRLLPGNLLFNATRPRKLKSR